MNILDIIIIIFLLFGILAGLKNGFTKQLVAFLGFIFVIYTSYSMKNIISVNLYNNLPFFDFNGILKGVSVFNIILYEAIAFIAIFIVLGTILGIVVLVTDLFEKAMSFLIIPGMFSKILGMIVGFLEYYIIAFCILYILNLPIYDFNFIKESDISNKMLKYTPVLTDLVRPALVVFDDLSKIKDKYKVVGNANEFNLEALDILLKHKFVTLENIDNLVKTHKLKINDIESVLIKYRKKGE